MQLISILFFTLYCFTSFSQTIQTRVIHGDTITVGNLSPCEEGDKFIDSLIIEGVDTIIHYNFKDAMYGWASGSSISKIIWYFEGEIYFKVIDDLSHFKTIQPHSKSLFEIPLQYFFKNELIIQSEETFGDEIIKKEYTAWDTVYMKTNSNGDVILDSLGNPQFSAIRRTPRVGGEVDRYKIQIYINKEIITKTITGDHLRSGVFLNNYDLKYLRLINFVSDLSEERSEDNRILESP